MANKLFGTITLNAAGTTFNNRQGILWNLRKHEDGSYVSLRREKKNADDPNAIAIIVHPKGTKPAKAGYVPKNIAAWLTKYMDEGKIVRAYRPEKDAKFVVGNGKKDKGNLGLKIKVVYELRESDVAREIAYE